MNGYLQFSSVLIDYLSHYIVRSFLRMSQEVSSNPFSVDPCHRHLKSQRPSSYPCHTLKYCSLKALQHVSILAIDCI